MFQLQSKNQWMRSSKSLIEKPGDKYSFRDELYSFLNNTICHCYRHLAQVDRSNVERLINRLSTALINYSSVNYLRLRFMWAIIHIFGACSLIFFTKTIYASFAENPLITTLYDTIYPVGNIPFPAVSICSNNRISKREAIAFAKEL